MTHETSPKPDESPIAQAVGYIRVHRARGASGQVAVQSQRIAIELYARESGYKIVEWASDIVLGRDASFSKRANFDRAVSRARADRLPIIMADALRIIRDAGPLFWALANGVTLRSARDGGMPNRTAIR